MALVELRILLPNNVRFGRKHSTEYIRTRLAALDFILGKLDYKFFETEQEKVRHFTEQLGVDKKYLPAKRYAGAIGEQFTDRYFVDKFPMFVIPSSSSPVVSFSFVPLEPGRPRRTGRLLLPAKKGGCRGTPGTIRRRSCGPGRRKSQVQPFRHHRSLPTMARRAGELRSSPKGIRSAAKASDRDVRLHPREWPGSSLRATSEQFGEISLEKYEQATFR